MCTPLSVKNFIAKGVLASDNNKIKRGNCMKHKGKSRHENNKKFRKAQSLPPAREPLESQSPQAPKPGTNAQNQFR
jgi:hypothetical protein